MNDPTAYEFLLIPISLVKSIENICIQSLVIM